MFDAKSILESLVRGAAQPAPSQGQSGGGLADILGQILGGAQNQGASRGQPQGGGGLGGGLGDLLGELERSIQGKGAQRSAVEAPNAPSGGGLEDILGQLKDQLGKAGGAIQGGSGGQGGGGLMDVLGQVLAQATQGVKEGAGKIDSRTGASDAFGKATGQNPADLLKQLQDLVRDNPLAAGGAMGGLGGLVLGTKTGRSIAGSAARIGALALIGGLAYKAFQNYQTGKPLITGAAPAESAPQGSGFEPAAVTNDAAQLYIRAMIAAAAADGRIDDAEQAKVIGGLKQAGLDAEAEEFLANALNNPVSPQDLAGAVSSPEEAIQVYTAARMVIEPDTRGEQQFLSSLATALGIDKKLAAHIDAATRSAAA
ncbi:MAG: tellurite resistance TerB family protein [Parvularculaceae bacterium]